MSISPWLSACEAGTKNKWHVQNLRISGVSLCWALGYKTKHWTLNSTKIPVRPRQTSDFLVTGPWTLKSKMPAGSTVVWESHNDAGIEQIGSNSPVWKTVGVVKTRSRCLVVICIGLEKYDLETIGWCYDMVSSIIRSTRICACICTCAWCYIEFLQRSLAKSSWYCKSCWTSSSTLWFLVMFLGAFRAPQHRLQDSCSAWGSLVSVLFITCSNGTRSYFKRLISLQ